MKKHIDGCSKVDNDDNPVPTKKFKSQLPKIDRFVVKTTTDEKI